MGSHAGIRDGETTLIRLGVLTISDRSARGERPDASGPAIVQRAETLGWKVCRRGVVSDDPSEIESTLRSWADSAEIDVLLTTGGTGFAGRDRAPEATRAVIDRLAPGMAEAMRQASLNKTPHAMLSRAVCGLRGSCLIVNLPGSPTAALENLAVIEPALPHAADLLRENPGAEAGHALGYKP
jgi:molybdopterin adenylyltransferase